MSCARSFRQSIAIGEVILAIIMNGFPCGLSCSPLVGKRAPGEKNVCRVIIIIIMQGWRAAGNFLVLYNIKS